MDRRLLEAAHKIQTVPTADRVWEVLIAALGGFGLSHALYVTNADGPAPDWVVMSTLPDNWPRALTNDPTFSEPFLDYCCATFEPTKLGPEYLEDQNGYVDDASVAYVKQAAQTGWLAALGLPCSLHGSGRHGGFVIGNGMSRYDFERKIIPLTQMLHSFCLIAHHRLSSLQFRMEKPRQDKPLSAREHQTLELMATGLRPKQIAAQLGVSEASIRLYLKNARSKLGAGTKEEALVIFVQKRAALIES